MPPFVPPSIPKCYAWCLSCGQSFEAAELDARWRCIWCDAPAERLVVADRPITPPVINGKPLAFSVLVRNGDKPKYVSLAVPQAVRRREFREVKAPKEGQRSPRPRQTGESMLGRRQNIPLIELSSGQCRFATTDEPPHLFCGAGGFPYCAAHAHIVYAGRLADRMTQEDGR